MANVQDNLEIGSIVEFNSKLGMVCGYTLTSYEEKTTIAYLIVPMPYGFKDLDNVFSVASPLVRNVVCRGYRNEAAEAFLSKLSSASGNPFSMRDVEEYRQSILKRLEGELLSERNDDE